MELDRLNSDIFQEYAGRKFVFVDCGGEFDFEATLVRCLLRPESTMPGRGRLAFSLLFITAAVELPRFNGAMFLIRHPTAGSLGPIYAERVLSPVAEEARIEVVFN